MTLASAESPLLCDRTVTESDGSPIRGLHTKFFANSHWLAGVTILEQYAALGHKTIPALAAPKHPSSRTRLFSLSHNYLCLPPSTNQLVAFQLDCLFLSVYLFSSTLISSYILSLGAGFLFHPSSSISPCPPSCTPTTINSNTLTTVPTCLQIITTTVALDAPPKWPLRMLNVNFEVSRVCESWLKPRR